MPTLATVWLDHHEARVFLMSSDAIDASTIASPTHHHHRHPRGHGEAKEHPDDAKRFFHELSRSLDSASALLIVGPSTAKLDLIRYLHEHEHALEAKVVGVETVDHPSDGQLIAYAKRYFHASPIRT